MSLKSFLQKIGLFFTALFNEAEKTWSKLSPEIQDAMKQGSGILDIINENVKETPEFILELIQKKYPEVNKESLLAGLLSVSKGLNIIEGVNSPTLEATVSNLALYLNTLENQFWANAASSASKLLAFFLAPQGNKWALFESLMEFVYQTFIKESKS